MNLLTDWNFNKNILLSASAIKYKNTSLTYTALENDINLQAKHLHDRGVTDNSFVPLLFGNTPGFIINIFALWKIGAVPVPINTRYTPAETEEILNFIGSTHIIAEKEFIDKFEQNKYKIITDISIQESTDEFPFITSPPEQTALIIFTSGSSGKPKGVELTFNNLIESAITGNQFLNQARSDRWLASLPFYHVGGFSIIIRSVLFGASLIIPDSLETKDLCNSIINEKPTLASLVSTQLLRLIETGCTPNEELRNVLLGGGFVETKLIKKALRNNWKVSKVYGSSETASMVTILDCTKEYKIDSAGKAMPPNEIRIINSNNEILPPNSSGQIIVKGPSVARGYIYNPEETPKKFMNGYYHTGDIGYLDDEGYLFIEARRTDLIITGGENVNPSEVENEILKHPDIIEAAVFPIVDTEWGQVIAAAIITKNKKQITSDELKIFLKDLLAGYKIPKKIIVVEELPKTELGKIQKEKLKILYSTDNQS